MFKTLIELIITQLFMIIMRLPIIQIYSKLIIKQQVIIIVKISMIRIKLQTTPIKIGIIQIITR